VLEGRDQADPLRVNQVAHMAALLVFNRSEMVRESSPHQANEPSCVRLAGWTCLWRRWTTGR